MEYSNLFDKYKAESLYGRYIHLSHIEPLLHVFEAKGSLDSVGQSVLGKPLYKYQCGNGNTKIFIWSQMHGNESTTTKALFDFLNYLHSNENWEMKLLEKFTFCILPMVNPDGASLYTRENANGVDINRDSQKRSQPESRVLRQVFDDFKPDYCFNLHDQRTIFGVGNTGFPATVSFLAPSYDEDRAINSVRKKAMDLIVAMNKTLQKYIPNQVGRFDDAFNLDCIGDTFQSLGVPTVLFEAGHFPKDYDREQTRKMIFIALLSGLMAINENDIVHNDLIDYLNIPQNTQTFYDIIYKNIKINYDGNKIITNFASQYKEELIDDKISFKAYIQNIGNLTEYFAHQEYDAEGRDYYDDFDNMPKINQLANFSFGNDMKFVNGILS